MAYFEQAVYALENLGLTDVILPFMIIFVIMFATLTKARIFGAESRKYSIIVSLAIALLVVIPHVTHRYPAGKDVVEIMNKVIPSVSIVAIAIVMFLVLVGILGAQTSWWGGWVSGLAVLGSVVAIIYIFGSAIGWVSYMPSWMMDSSTQAMVVILLVFGIIVWFVTAEPGQPGVGGALQKIGDALKGK